MPSEPTPSEYAKSRGNFVNVANETAARICETLNLSDIPNRCRYIADSISGVLHAEVMNYWKVTQARVPSDAELRKRLEALADKWEKWALYLRNTSGNSPLTDIFQIAAELRAVLSGEGK